MQKSVSAITRQWLTILAVLMAIAINALSNFFPPRGQNIGEVSNTILGGVLITPDSYAFAIWGLIYIGLITYSLYQAMPAQRNNSACARISRLLIGACLLQMLWVMAFLLYQFWLSVALMFGILGCLWAAYIRSRTVRPTRTRRWLLQAPISVYFSWITVAAVVNVASALYAMQNKTGLPAALSLVASETVSEAVPNAVSASALLWTVLLMLVSAGIAASVAWRHGDAAYPAVATWALSAIAVRHANAFPSIALTGVGLSVLLSTLIVHIVVTGKGRPSSADLA
ncbi:MAG: tryptophan-rich sensory protein [Cyanobacteria bacterium P01_D01_bin.105]